MKSSLLIFLLIAGLSVCAEEWWESETRMAEGGKLDLSQKDWWPRAMQLKTGEYFTISSTEPSGGKTIVRRETRTRSRSPQDMIVWILDDDGDMPPDAAQGDTDSDCYVVDHGCDGTVDRMVDYIDADRDRIPDEMEIRYFVEGELRRAWFGTDLDGDGKMWHTADYEYPGDFFPCDPYGNNEIYMNKYHSQKDCWIPISECPFSFYDTDGDGESEAVVRFSAAPLDFSSESDPDYANSQKRYEGPFDPSMERMGVVNVRYSLDIDARSGAENPLHYEMGYNLVGDLPYEFEGMNRLQELRRSPKTTVCIPFDRARKAAETYPAQQTGFSWHEFEDASIKIGHPSRPEYDRRWEGVFWTWQRRIMHNTGGPVQQWNIRREFMPAFSDRRQLYYSPVDRRIHLKGATEGWLHAGYIESDEILGEIRMLDANADGYFDRWEYYWKDEKSPYRVASVPDAANRNIAEDWDALTCFYNEEVIPEAIRINRELIQSLERFEGEYAPAIPAFLENALQMDISLDEQRYILDWIREYRYRCFIKRAREISYGKLHIKPDRDPRQIPDFRRQSMQSWEDAVFLSRIEEAYARGEWEKTLTLLERIRKSY